MQATPEVMPDICPDFVGSQWGSRVGSCQVAETFLRRSGDDIACTLLDQADFLTLHLGVKAGKMPGALSHQVTSVESSQSRCFHVFKYAASNRERPEILETYLLSP